MPRVNPSHTRELFESPSVAELARCHNYRDRGFECTSLLQLLITLIYTLILRNCNYCLLRNSYSINRKLALWVLCKQCNCAWTGVYKQGLLAFLVDGCPRNRVASHYLCIYACMNACMQFVRTCVRACVHTYTHTHIRAYMYTYTFTYTYMYIGGLLYTGVIT